MSRPVRPRPLPALLLVLGLLLGAVPTLVVVGAAPVASAVGTGDDYPTSLRTPDRDAVVDPWLFYNRECTSFVAWRLNQQRGHVTAPWSFTNYMKGPNGTSVHFGNATQWRDAAVAGGWPVDQTPKVGSVAYFAAYQGGAGRFGHVAVVTGVLSDGTVSIEEYNVVARGVYGTRTHMRATAYLHIADAAVNPAPVAPSPAPTPRPTLTPSPSPSPTPTPTLTPGPTPTPTQTPTPAPSPAAGLVAGAAQTSAPVGVPSWPGSPSAGLPVAVTVPLTNTSASALSLGGAKLRITGAGVDVYQACWWAYTLEPGASRSCTVTVSPTTSGALTVAPDWGTPVGVWHPGVLRATTLQVSAAPFSDVPTTGPGMTQAAWITTRRILPPSTAGVFGPRGRLTRQQAALGLYRLAGSPAMGPTPTMGDVRARTVGERAVRWAVSTGALTPMTTTSFGTTSPATRADLATALWTMAGRPSAGGAATRYPDLQASGSTTSAMTWALSTGRLQSVDGAAAAAVPVTRSSFAGAAYAHTGGR